MLLAGLYIYIYIFVMNLNRKYVNWLNLFELCEFKIYLYMLCVGYLGALWVIYELCGLYMYLL
jgi:hypothetical protein